MSVELLSALDITTRVLIPGFLVGILILWVWGDRR